MKREVLRAHIVERGLYSWISKAWFVRICPRAKPHIIPRGVQP
jgi:hypothetical protein